MSSHLRNRQHFSSFYRVIIEREMLWEHDPKASVFTAFLTSLKLSRDSIETRRKCFLFLSKKLREKDMKITRFFRLSKSKFSLLAPLLRQQFALVLCFY